MFGIGLPELIILAVIGIVVISILKFFKKTGLLGKGQSSYGAKSYAKDPVNEKLENQLSSEENNLEITGWTAKEKPNGADVNVKNDGGDTPILTNAGEQDIEELIQGLISDDSGSQYNSFLRIRELCSTDDDRIFAPLVEVLSSGNDAAREFAATLLGGLGDNRAVEPLIKVLNDPWWAARHSAVEALGEIGDHSAVGPIEKVAREDTNERVSGRAAIVLKEKFYCADINAKENDGQTALMSGALNGQTDIVKLLLDKGVDVDLKSDVGWTALMFAADKGFTNIVKLILQAGADINAQDNDGYTALMGSAFSGRTEVVRLLLENDADMNAKATDDESRGTTALMSAAYNGYTEIVKLLISKGADLTAENMYGYTALKSASSKGHMEIVKLLKKAGAKG